MNSKVGYSQEPAGESQSKIRGTGRKDFSSLKRNLFTEFNSISNFDENIKKDTIEEASNSQNI